MREITAPIIAITLVLLSVFVPVAFIPGISGELFRQFAVTVAVAMFLSAINALTLSPALCAILLKPHHGPRRGIIGGVMRFIDRVRDAYGAAVARLVRISDHRARLRRRFHAWRRGLSKITPTGFLPEDDQGAFFVVTQLPGGASVARTSEVVHKAEQILGRRAVDCGLHLNHRPELHRQLFPVELGFLCCHAEALRGAPDKVKARTASSPG